MEHKKITDTDLLNNKCKYGVDILEKNVNHLNNKILINTQILTPSFCIKYLFDMDISSGSEDSYLWDVPYILDRQPHITEQELYDEIKLQNK